MQKFAEDVDLNQISLTGVRALVLLGMLIKAPRSLEEIRKTFIDFKIMEESHSTDILRIDLNTLKYMGCNISRASQSTGYKYELKEHPFSLKIEDSDIKILKRVYEQLKQSEDLHLLIEYHELFKKLAAYVSEEEYKEELLGVSILKHYDIEILRDLISDCRHERVIKINYKSPSSGRETIKEIAAQKLEFKNDKLYLYGYDFGKEDQVVLNLNRIKSVIARSIQKKGFEPKQTTVKFYLKDFGYDVISDEETVLEAGDKGYLIEGKYYNEFLATQRILSFGSKCRILEPLNFRNKIISKLKEMRNVYEH